MSGTREFGPIQLARWLGVTPEQLRRAQGQGLVPPPDVDDTKWSESLARTLPDQVDGILGELAAREASAAAAEPTRRPHPDPRRLTDFGPIQLARWLGVKRWQVERAAEYGVIPPPDLDKGRWSRELAQDLPDHVSGIIEAVGEHPGLGAKKSAARLGERTGLDVTIHDVRELARQGLLRPVGSFRSHPLFGLEGLDALSPRDIESVIADRECWVADSLTSREAADSLGWSEGRFEVTAEQRGVCPGRFDRYARIHVERLGADDTASRGLDLHR